MRQCLVDLMRLQTHVMFASRQSVTCVGAAGLGAVGMGLAERLQAEGAHLLVADVRSDAVESAVDRLGAEAVPVGEIHAAAADVFCPCALGGVVQSKTLRPATVGIVEHPPLSNIATPKYAKSGPILHLGPGSLRSTEQPKRNVAPVQVKIAVPPSPKLTTALLPALPSAIVLSPFVAKPNVASCMFCKPRCRVQPVAHATKTLLSCCIAVLVGVPTLPANCAFMSAIFVK